MGLNPRLDPINALKESLRENGIHLGPVVGEVRCELSFRTMRQRSPLRTRLDGACILQLRPRIDAEGVLLELV